MFLILTVDIVECDAAHNCSSQGICGPDGACDCDPSFYGDNCTSKLRKICDEYLVDFKTNMFSLQTFFVAVCHYLLTCSDHGVCSDVGTCQCDEGFYGDSCSSKHDNLLLNSVFIYQFARFLAFADQGPLVAELANVSTIPLTELELFIKCNDLTLVDMNQNTIFLEFIHF